MTPGASLMGPLALSILAPFSEAAAAVLWMGIVCCLEQWMSAVWYTLTSTNLNWVNITKTRVAKQRHNQQTGPA